MNETATDDPFDLEKLRLKSPLKTIPRGAIYAERAYIQSKMLDHSKLRRALVRNITPSDLDAVIVPVGGEIEVLENVPYIDAAGNFIFMELTRGAPEWHFLKKGQRLGYENLVRQTQGSIAVLCHHDVPSFRKIDTLNDITSFQLMVWHYGPKCSEVFVGQPKWEKFITDWVNTSEGPTKWREYILTEASNGPGAA